MSEILKPSSDLDYGNMSLELHSSTILKELHIFIFTNTDLITKREIFFCNKSVINKIIISIIF